MVALSKQFFHHEGTKPRSRCRNGGFGCYGRSPAASVCSVNSVAFNDSNGGVTGNITNGTTDYIWQGWQTVEERNPLGGSGRADTPIKQYIWGTYIDECVQLNSLAAASAQGLAAGNYYLLQDLLYRAVALTNSSGQIVEAYDCEAYGNSLLFTAPDTTGNWWGDGAVQSSYGANENIYCGYRSDPETALYYVRNRTYNPVLGRWIQRDPIGYSGGINLYEYVGGTAAGDPAGLRPFALALTHRVDARRILAGPVRIRTLEYRYGFDVRCFNGNPSVGSFRDLGYGFRGSWGLPNVGVDYKHIHLAFGFYLAARTRAVASTVQETGKPILFYNIHLSFYHEYRAGASIDIHGFDFRVGPDHGFFFTEIAHWWDVYLITCDCAGNAFVNLLQGFP